MFTGRLDGLYGYFKISQVIHGVKNTKDIYTIIRCAFDKFADYVIGIMTIAEEILSA